MPPLPPACFKTADNGDATRRIWRTVFRFLNVVEPGPELVLSPTRVGMWIIVFVLPFMAIMQPGHLISIITTVVTALPLLLNYMHQRRVDAQTGSNPNSVQPPKVTT